MDEGVEAAMKETISISVETRISALTGGGTAYPIERANIGGGDDVGAIIGGGGGPEYRDFGSRRGRRIGDSGGGGGGGGIDMNGGGGGGGGIDMKGGGGIELNGSGGGGGLYSALSESISSSLSSSDLQRQFDTI